MTSTVRLGATLFAEGCEFAVHCPFAEQVYVCLLGADGEIQQHAMTVKNGSLWQLYIAGIKAGQLYTYKVQGEHKPEQGQYCEPDTLLLDPYAQDLVHLDSQQPAGLWGKVVAALPALVAPKPQIAAEQRILYEVHVKGMTQQHPLVPEQLRGRYLGLSSQAVITHLQALGITSVQVLPIFAFQSETQLHSKGLCNYWGYNPLSFFCAEPKYAVADARQECRQMIEEFHRHGIEVILDVVFNHTAEGGNEGGVMSLKGLDSQHYYLFENNEFDAHGAKRFANHSGCGNSLNLAQPTTLALVMDAMRYWVGEMGVDGFRFDLAASLGRSPYLFSPLSSFFKCIQQDPLLSRVVLIAEPWDIGTGGYQLGNFPDPWFECNDKYRDCVRAFWRGDQGVLAEFATRLMGSRDCFLKQRRSAHASVNYVCYHDGFCLQDLVSYQHKHNDANGENNQDGHGHNVSANYGVEGPTNDLQIAALRERQKRNLVATLLLSQGVVHFLAGDEIGRTQQGNNNAYCQDNPISWLNWALQQTQKDFKQFCANVIAMRKNSRLLGKLYEADDGYHHPSQINLRAIEWRRLDGQPKQVSDWQNGESQCVAVHLVGNQQADCEQWLLLFNASDEKVEFHLPNTRWHLTLDTRLNTGKPSNIKPVEGVFEMQHKSLAVLKAADII